MIDVRPVTRHDIAMPYVSLGDTLCLETSSIKSVMVNDCPMSYATVDVVWGIMHPGQDKGTIIRF